MQVVVAGCMHAPCPACSGSGIVSLPCASDDEKKILREALYVTWAKVGVLEDEIAMERRKDKNELAAARELIERLQTRIRIKDDEIDYLRKAAIVAHGWNGRPSENGQALKTRREFRAEEKALEAKSRGEEPPPGKKRGGQAGSPGISCCCCSSSSHNKTMTFAPETCHNCGGTCLRHTRTIRKRINELVGGDAGVKCVMYEIQVATCQTCGAEVIPHTDTIRGTSFGPILRATIQTYHNGNASQGSVRMFLTDIHGARFSSGAISNCCSAMARHLEGKKRDSSSSSSPDRQVPDTGCGCNPLAAKPMIEKIRFSCIIGW